MTRGLSRFLGTRLQAIFGLRIAAAVVCVCAILVIPGQGVAATAPQLTPLGMGHGDTIWNYDFTQIEGAGWTKVDWAVSVLFYNFAWIDGVKDVMYPTFYATGSSKYAYMDDGAQNWVGYDSDKGRKTARASCFGSSPHYRVYAPSRIDPNNNRMYNLTFGYYVFATTHRDNHELCNDWYDDSEGTEWRIYTRFRDRGYPSYYDYGWFYNREWRNEGEHHWRNDGYATYINFCPGSPPC